ncbi:unnamed protein product [Closterium sp. NIES-64]|nr:unnamed protein product [Closterium sp. NIES-64]
MADLHCKFASLGVDDAAAHNHSTEALKNESHETLIAASSAADEDGVDDLFARLSRDVCEATTEQQQLDAIVSTLFAANAMCFWPDSDAHRPQRAFGFRVLRTLPPAAETLEMRGEPAGGRVRPLTLVYVPDSKLPSPHRPPAALATAPALAPSTPPSPSGFAVIPLSPTAVLVALDITPVRASPRRLPSRLTPSKPVEISLIRDIISFVSQRASTNAAKEGLLNASVQELADTDAPGLSDEDVKELNCMLKTWGVDADAKQLDTVVDKYGRTALHVAARDGDVFVVHALLGLGMPVSMRCNNRSTPMHRAAWGGHVACMKLLQRYARQGKWEAVKWLAQQGIDPQEVETNPSPEVLPDDLLARAVQIVKRCLAPVRITDLPSAPKPRSRLRSSTFGHTLMSSLLRIISPSTKSIFGRSVLCRT